MRPLFLLLGVWHGLVSLWAVLYGLWAIAISLLYSGHGASTGGFALFGFILLASGVASLPALGLVAQGGQGQRNAAAVLMLPFAAMALWTFPNPGGWLYAMFLLPGAILGACAMFAKE